MKGSVPYSCTFEATPTAKNDVDEIVVTLKMLLNVWKWGGGGGGGGGGVRRPKQISGEEKSYLCTKP